jgi:hypothetical protein
MNKIIIVMAILFSSTYCFAETQKGRIIANIDAQKLHLSIVLEEGNGTYSVIDNNRVVVAKGKELLIIDNNTVMQKLTCPAEISTFDINKHGNGAIVSEGVTSDSIIMYKVKAFYVQPRPLRINLPGAKREIFIFSLDMIDDFTIRLNLNVQDSILLSDINKIEMNQYIVLDDVISRYISHNIANYIGSYEDEYYFLDSTKWDVIERVIAFKRDNIEQLLTIPWIKRDAMARTIGRIIELGVFGRAIPMSNNVRVDESSGLFYVMLVQKGNLVIREFDIKDFASSK